MNSKLFSLFSIVGLAALTWAEVPKEKACEGFTKFQVGNLEVTYYYFQEKDVCSVGTRRGDGQREYRYSTSSTGLFYVWNLPDQGYLRKKKDDDFKHVFAFLPITSRPFPHPMPGEESDGNLYLHLPNGENLIVDPQTGKVDWEKSFASGLTSIKATQTAPDQNSRLLQISDYAKNRLVIDFGASALGDPFLKRGGKAHIIKFVDGERHPRRCVVTNLIFRRPDFEPSFSDERVNTALKECEKQTSWTKAKK